MSDVLEGRIDRAMPSDPDALRRGTRSIVLTTMAIPFGLTVGHAAYLLGVWAGQFLTR